MFQVNVLQILLKQREREIRDFLVLQRIKNTLA